MENENEGLLDPAENCPGKNSPVRLMPSGGKWEVVSENVPMFLQNGQNAHVEL